MASWRDRLVSDRSLPDISHIKIGKNTPYEAGLVLKLVDAFIMKANGTTAHGIIDDALHITYTYRDRKFGSNLNFVCADHYLENYQYTAKFGPLGRFDAIARTYIYDRIKELPGRSLLKQGPGELSKPSPLARKWALMAVEDGVAVYGCNDIEMSVLLRKLLILKVTHCSAKKEFGT